MKLRIALTACLTLATSATCYGQKPDLTITEILWRKKPHTVQIVVANLGQAKAAESMGSYGCQGALKEQEGMSIGYGSMFGIPALLPNQKWKIVLNCKGDEITGAGVDVEKKIVESNENNNYMNLAGGQKKNGPIKKPDSIKKPGL